MPRGKVVKWKLLKAWILWCAKLPKFLFMNLIIWLIVSKLCFFQFLTFPLPSMGLVQLWCAQFHWALAAIWLLHGDLHNRDRAARSDWRKELPFCCDRGIGAFGHVWQHVLLHVRRFCSWPLLGQDPPLRLIRFWSFVRLRSIGSLWQRSIHWCWWITSDIIQDSKCFAGGMHMPVSHVIHYVIAVSLVMCDWRFEAIHSGCDCRGSVFAHIELHITLYANPVHEWNISTNEQTSYTCPDYAEEPCIVPPHLVKNATLPRRPWRQQNLPGSTGFQLGSLIDMQIEKCVCFSFCNTVEPLN